MGKGYTGGKRDNKDEEEEREGGKEDATQGRRGKKVGKWVEEMRQEVELKWMGE